MNYPTDKPVPCPLCDLKANSVLHLAEHLCDDHHYGRYDGGGDAIAFHHTDYWIECVCGQRWNNNEVFRRQTTSHLADHLLALDREGLLKQHLVAGTAKGWRLTV